MIKNRGMISCGATALAIKLLAVIGGIVVSITFGYRPETAIEYMEAISQNSIIALLRDDFFNLVLISMYFFSFAAIFIIQKKHKQSLTILAIIFTYVSIILAITSHAGLSMIHLSSQYFENNDPIVRQNILAASEAIISKNMWNSTSGLFAGILMQGSGVMISIAMIGNKNFRRLTIISGIACNGLDLINHLLHYNLPSIAYMFLYISGIFYLLWYIALGLDFLKYRNIKEVE